MTRSWNFRLNDADSNIIMIRGIESDRHGPGLTVALPVTRSQGLPVVVVYY